MRVSLDLPPGGQALVSTYRLFMDPVVSETRAAPVDAGHDVRVTSRYVDANGRFHLAGEVTNPGRDSVILRLQTTVYDGATQERRPGRRVLRHAAAAGARARSGRSILSTGARPTPEPGLADKLARREAAEDVRVEPFQSWTDRAMPVAVAR